jgi:hypothetical protein
LIAVQRYIIHHSGQLHEARVTGCTIHAKYSELIQELAVGSESRPNVASKPIERPVQLE